MVGQRVKRFLLSAGAILAIILPVLAPLPVQASPTVDPSGNGELNVKLNPERTDVTLVARRLGNGDPQTVNFNYDAASQEWESGTIPNTGPSNCGTPANTTFNISVRDTGGNLLAYQSHNVACGNIAPFTIDVPAPPTAHLTGTIDFVDAKDGNKVKTTAGLDIKLVDLNAHTIDYPKNVDANGSYNLYSTTPGKAGVSYPPAGQYTIIVTGKYTNPNDPADTVNINIKQNITLNPGDNVLDLHQGVIDQGQVTCDAGALSWLVCSLVSWLIDGIDWIRDNVILPFLKEPPVDLSTSVGNVTYQAWAAFRNIGNIFFVLIFFLIIFGTALGFDNYTVKKMLPRLIAAAILVQFSYLLSALIVDLGNVIGQGAAAILNTIIDAGGPPKIDFTNAGASISSVVGVALLGAAGVTAVVTLTASTVISLFIAVLAVFFTLVFRKILITLLIMISPIAFMLWVLPNTQKFFKEWYETFIVLVMMYPLIIILFEVGRIFSKAAEATAGSNTSASLVEPLFALAGYVVPLILVPATFKVGGRIMKAGVNGVNMLANKGHSTIGNKSDYAKLADEARRNNNALRATDPNNKLGGFGRALARTRGGFSSGYPIPIPGLKPTATAQRHLNAAANKALDARVGDEGVAMSQHQFNEEGYAAMGAAAADSSNQARQIAAIQRLSQTAGGRAILRKVRSGMVDANGNMSDRDFKTWQKGTEKLNKAAAPDLVKGDGAFKGVTASELAAFDPSTAEAAVQHWQGLAQERAALGNNLVQGTPEFDRAQEIDKTLDRAHNAIAGLRASSVLKTQVEGKSMDAFNAWSPAGAPAGAGASNPSTSGTVSVTIPPNIGSGGPPPPPPPPGGAVPLQTQQWTSTPSGLVVPAGHPLADPAVEGQPTHPGDDRSIN